MKACGISTVSPPSRWTFDRRLKTISIDIKERITTMGHRFISEDIVDPFINAAIDSTLIKARGKVWNKSSMKKGIVPRSGIDTDARWAMAIQRDGYLYTNYI